MKKKNIKLKLLDIKLKKSFFYLNEDIIAKIKKNTKLEIKNELRLDINQNKKDKTFLEVIIQIKNESSNSPFNFNIVYAGLFQIVSNNMTQEEIKKRATINCAAIIFPYIREHLADLTRRSGIPPYHISPINFVELYKNQENKA